MALTACLVPPTLRPSSRPATLRLPLYSRAGARVAAVRRGGGGATEVRHGAALVWFKHDLRTDDHPGLVAAAAQHRTVVPLYVFDPRILSRFSDGMLDLLLLTLRDLRTSLKNQGSDLFIGFGSAEVVIMKYVDKVKPTHIFAEEEVEYNLCKVISNVDTSLSAITFPWGSPKFVLWDTSLYDIENWEELPELYPDFQKLQLPLKLPLATPSVPLLDMELHGDDLPTFHDLKKFLNENACQSDRSWTFLKEISANTILRKTQIGQMQMKADLVKGLENHKEKNDEGSLVSNNLQRMEHVKSVSASRGGVQVVGGTDVILNGLAAYLGCSEGTARDNWQESHEKVRKAESRKGASFGALFESALFLGTISRRRVYHEAIKYAREHSIGFLSPFRYSAPTVAAVIDTIFSMEWYWILALKSQRSKKGMYPLRIWRWKGYLIQYTVIGFEGPAVLFVHGFGVFLEHFRDNISSIAGSGHRVWAVTLLGFGKSEKPNVTYSEPMWAEFLRDFIIDVVGEPVHLVGNSIGGYFVACVAGLWPALSKSLVLINTAGSVIPGYSSVQSTEGRQTSRFAWLSARILLLYLRLRADNILKSCYPTNMKRVDNWLIREILRASYDPGVFVVLESVLNFNLPIPLNYLLDSFGGKALIIQGMKDPISRSKLRLSLLREHCNGVTIKEVDAGHCPHDEVPDEVNSILSKWIQTAGEALTPLRQHDQL